MRQFTDPRVQEKWKRTGEMLRKGQKPTQRKSIDEMTLSEALETEQKYLNWAEKNKDHEDFEIKKHIYNNYLKKRIEYLQSLPKQPDPTPLLQTDTNEVTQNEQDVHYALMSYEELQKLENECEEWLKNHIYQQSHEEWQDRKKDYDLIVFWLNKKSVRLLTQQP